MDSPAQRYAAARDRVAHPALSEFAAGYDFGLDPFQREACEALEAGHGVLVCAPTGAGKTVVGEFAVHLALRAGGKCFYTTPIKALSNQKYGDLVRRYGAAQIGLLTGDNSINGDAPVVVMTTEVLRNMLYVGSAALTDLRYVVMDEVHYLADRFRGAVWEEVIIHLSEDVRLVSLSATVSNAEEFADWLVTVRGDTTVVVSEERPVPLWQHMLVGRGIYDLFADAATLEVDDELLRAIREQERRTLWEQRTRSDARRGSRRGPPPRRGGRKWRPPDRVMVVEQLDRAGLLPAIVFVFSRAGCDAAVGQCVRGGLRLTDPDDRPAIREVAERRTEDIPAEDLEVLGYWEWLEALEHGIAAHHAGMIPPFKEAVEELFAAGLIQVVFATETLALGINMPARSVVLERLVKFNGETHADLTPGEYTQLTGRAGRRGIDIEGHAVVAWSPDIDPAEVAGLASTRTYPLRSSFGPSYNMAVNLVGQLGRPQARTLLESSFAQFQTDRAVVGLSRQLQRNDEALAGYASAMTCHLGEFSEYAELRRQIGERESRLSKSDTASRRSEAAASLDRLRRGDVVRIPAGRRAGLAVVVEVGRGPRNEPPLPTVLTLDHRLHKLSAIDVPYALEPAGTLRIPAHFDPRSPRSRRDLASSLRNLQLDDAPARKPTASAADDDELDGLRARMRSHPCHGCADREEHARWAERARQLQRETEKLRSRIDRRTHSLARTFDQVCDLLTSHGYLDGEAVTDDGRRLSRIWAESDLLVAESLRRGLWEDLGAAELAAVASALVYEARATDVPTPRVPDAVRPPLGELARLASELGETEEAAGLQRSRQPDNGFAWPIYRWARGESLGRALSSSDVGRGDLPAGDFVRWCRQVIDLLDQIGKVAAPTIAATARAAIREIDRGVVAAARAG